MTATKAVTNTITPKDLRKMCFRLGRLCVHGNMTANAYGVLCMEWLRF